MIPEADLARVQRWVDTRNQELPEEVRDKVRYELDVTNRTLTIIECRPPWRPEDDPDWTRTPIGRLRYTKYLREWSLYWSDRNLKFHRYDFVEPNVNVEDFLAEIQADPTGIFWGEFWTVSTHLPSRVHRAKGCDGTGNDGKR